MSMTLKMDHKFHFLTGDVNWKDYGGVWYRYDGVLCYTIIEFHNMQDCCGDVSDGKYLVTIGTIDLSAISYAEIARACKTIGITVEEAMKDQLMLLEACNAYGFSDRISYQYGNNYKKLMSWAKSY